MLFSKFATPCYMLLGKKERVYILPIKEALASCLYVDEQF